MALLRGQHARRVLEDLELGLGLGLAVRRLGLERGQRRVRLGAHRAARVRVRDGADELLERRLRHLRLHLLPLAGLHLGGLGGLGAGGGGRGLGRGGLLLLGLAGELGVQRAVDLVRLGLGLG